MRPLKIALLRSISNVYLDRWRKRDRAPASALTRIVPCPSEGPRKEPRKQPRKQPRKNPTEDPRDHPGEGLCATGSPSRPASTGVTGPELTGRKSMAGESLSGIDCPELTFRNSLSGTGSVDGRRVRPSSFAPKSRTPGCPVDQPALPNDALPNDAWPSPRTLHPKNTPMPAVVALPCSRRPCWVCRSARSRANALPPPRRVDAPHP